MIKLNCETPDKLRLQDMTPFQGDLKKRTPQEIEELGKTLVSDGLTMPFAIWKHEGKNYILDGHGRLEALIRLSMQTPDILTEEFPCLMIQAEDEQTARKLLLQITSQYGHVTKKGVIAFTASIPSYKAPVVCKAIGVRHRNKAPEQDLFQMVRIKVPISKVPEIREILKKCTFIEVLD